MLFVQSIQQFFNLTLKYFHPRNVGESPVNGYVADSTWGGSTGSGLFSSMLLEKVKGKELPITGYGGDLVSEEITSHADYNNEYTVYGAKQHCHSWSRDAKNETVLLGKYAQDPIAYSRCNAKFKRNYKHQTVTLTATKP